MFGYETLYYEKTGTKGNFWYIYEMHNAFPFGELFGYLIIKSSLIITSISRKNVLGAGHWIIKGVCVCVCVCVHGYVVY